MPWNYDDAQINGIIDSNIKSAPPAAPQINTAAVIRSCLKLMWAAIRGQVSQAVAACDATTASLVSRSLSLTSTIYVDGTNGNDARTGTTADNNAATGRVKTLERVVALHSGKTQRLHIVITGALDVSADVTLEIPFLTISVNGATTVLTFKKKIAYDGAVLAGEGNHRLICKSSTVGIAVTYGGQLIVEGHAGRTGTGNIWHYYLAQGAISLGALTSGNVTAECPTLSIWQIDGTITVGDNAILAYPGQVGPNYITMPGARYRRNTYTGSFTLGTNAVESRMQGDRTFLRQYHPVSSTDVNVLEGETVISPTNNKLYTKRGNTIRDAVGTTFA